MHLWLSTSVDTMAAAAAAAELLARYDEKLVAKGLPKNETMVEGSPFTAKESEVLAACRKECGAAAIDSFSSTWVDRMVRGMYTNNKGSHEARLKEIAVRERCAALEPERYFLTPGRRWGSSLAL